MKFNIWRFRNENRKKLMKLAKLWTTKTPILPSQNIHQKGTILVGGGPDRVFTERFLIPRRELRKQNRRWSNLFYLCFIFLIGNIYWAINLRIEIRLFETLDMFYCPDGQRDGTVVKNVLHFFSILGILNTIPYLY